MVGGSAKLRAIRENRGCVDFGRGGFDLHVRACCLPGALGSNLIAGSDRRRFRRLVASTAEEPAPGPCRSIAKCAVSPRVAELAEAAARKPGWQFPSVTACSALSRTVAPPTSAAHPDAANTTKPATPSSPYD